MMKKILVAMSGGVDSSASAAALCDAGYECIGVTMRLHNAAEEAEPTENSCCSLKDVEDARSAAVKLGIPYYVFNFTEDFQEQVIDRFIHAYECGDTPNPCIDCNRHMKFERLYHRAEVLGCDGIATGHYARIAYDDQRQRWVLKKSCNLRKDQSYVLYAMTQEQLSRTLFPLGEFSDKEQVRQLAASFGFRNAEKKDSQDICFVPDGDYAAFIRKTTGRDYPAGDFVDTNGVVLGQHKGMIHYTIGQRKGLGISAATPLYVCQKCMDSNTIVLSQEQDLYAKELTACDFNWIAFAEPPEEPVRVMAKVRYHAKEAAAIVTGNADGTVRVVFEEPQRAVTTGQAVVLYDGDVVVGGGTICDVQK